MKRLVIGILAHVDSGKTTLSEAMLYRAGALRKLGRVDHRDAFLDTDALERARGITIFSKQALLSLPEKKRRRRNTPMRRGVFLGIIAFLPMLLSFLFTAFAERIERLSFVALFFALLCVAWVREQRGQRKPLIANDVVHPQNTAAHRLNPPNAPRLAIRHRKPDRAERNHGHHRRVPHPFHPP
mgnify:CR=1 FL=1